MSAVALIPARMESSRYPGKPLAPILGVPMIVHCVKRAQKSKSISGVVVATCNREIEDAVNQYCPDVKVVMTANTHTRATDRIAEAVEKLSPVPQTIVMVQGDEPMVHPKMLDLALEPLVKDPSVQCTNLVAPITSDEEFISPNTIKVIWDKNRNILFMSREPIPTRRLSSEAHARFKQVCIMGFRKKALDLFVSLKPTPYEILESIDMNRFLENGLPLRGVPCDIETFAVDTPEDLKKVEALMRKENAEC